MNSSSSWSHCLFFQAGDSLCEPIYKTHIIVINIHKLKKNKIIKLSGENCKNVALESLDRFFIQNLGMDITSLLGHQQWAIEMEGKRA